MKITRSTQTLLMGALTLALLLSACAPRNEIQTSQGQALVEQGNAYMRCMQESDFNCAYALMSPAAKQLIDGAVKLAGSTVDIAGLFKAYGPTISSWTFDQVQISTRDGRTTGTLKGEVDMQDGKPHHVDLGFERDGETWKVRSSSIE